MLPEIAEKSREFFAEEHWQWGDASKPLLGTTINKFQALLTRVEPDKVASMVEQSR